MDTIAEMLLARAGDSRPGLRRGRRDVDLERGGRGRRGPAPPG